MGPEGVRIIFEAWECMHDGESLYINLLFLSPYMYISLVPMIVPNSDSFYMLASYNLESTV